MNTVANGILEVYHQMLNDQFCVERAADIDRVMEHCFADPDPSLLVARIHELEAALSEAKQDLGEWRSVKDLRDEVKRLRAALELERKAHADGQAVRNHLAEELCRLKAEQTTQDDISETEMDAHEKELMALRAEVDRAKQYADALQRQWQKVRELAGLAKYEMLEDWVRNAARAMKETGR